MIISNSTLAKLIGGLYSTDTQKGYMYLRRFDSEQLDYLKSVSQFWYSRARMSPGAVINMRTDSTSMAFDYRIAYCASADTVEVFVNGVPLRVAHIEDMGDEGRLEFELPDSDKEISVYLPSDCEMGIKDFTVNGSYRRLRHRQAPKVLFVGDSITQGYGSFRSGHTFVNVAARRLGYDALNQGIGGYVFDRNILTPMPGYSPDKIKVALGTNDYDKDGFAEAVSGFFERLRQVYSDVPLMVVTPLWRGREGDDIRRLREASACIREVCAAYPDMWVADGFDMVPNTPEYFYDGLHPSALGAEIYGNNLAELIRRCGF